MKFRPAPKSELVLLMVPHAKGFVKNIGRLAAAQFDD
jgi:hypothetical protein